jgi:hypothetical protein
MSQIQLLLTGPAFAVLALILFMVPDLRPRMYTRAIGCLGGCMCVPMIAAMVIGFLSGSYGFAMLALIIKPITALLGITLFIGYLTMWRSKRFPAMTLLPSVIILLASGADIHAFRMLAHGIGGGDC